MPLFLHQILSYLVDAVAATRGGKSHILNTALFAAVITLMLYITIVSHKIAINLFSVVLFQYSAYDLYSGYGVYLRGGVSNDGGTFFFFARSKVSAVFRKRWIRF